MPPVAVASPSALVTVSTPTPTGRSAPTTSKPSSKIVVHVFGAVRHPGLVRLPNNSRVQDAIEAAGGLTNRADPGEINLAQLLGDGQQVVIGTVRLTRRGKFEISPGRVRVAVLPPREPLI